MIKINLVRSVVNASDTTFAESTDVAGGSDIQRQGLTRFLIILLFPLGLYFYQSFILLPDLNARLNSKRNLLESLKTQNETSKGALEEKKKFEEDQAKLKKQIGAIDGLSSDRLKEVKILDTIQKDIPEKVWLSSLSIREEHVSISGNANSDADLTAFMDILSRSIYIKEVNLIKSAESTTAGAGLSKKFDITCAINREGAGNGGGEPTPGGTQ